MKEPKELAFEFEEIGLQEAELLGQVGLGKYSDLTLMLVKKIPEYEAANAGLAAHERKTLRFFLPGKVTLEEKVIKSLYQTVSKSLINQGLNWRVRYSVSTKAFVCVPGKSVTAVSGPGPAYHPMGRKVMTNDLQEKIKEMAMAGARNRDIVKALGISPSSVSRYTLPLHLVRQRGRHFGNNYAAKAARQVPVTPTQKPGGPFLNPEHFVNFAREVLDFHEPFKKQAPDKLDSPMRALRSAVIVVGTEDLGFKVGALDPVLGFKKGGAGWVKGHFNKAHQLTVSMLRQAIKEQKGDQK